MNTLRSLDIIIVLLGVITICVIISTVFEKCWPGSENRDTLTRFFWMEKEVENTSSAENDSTTQGPFVDGLKNTFSESLHFHENDDDEGCPRIITRAAWLAQPPTDEIQNLMQPVSFAMISHTGTSGCLTQSECILRVQLTQTFHIEAFRWFDIGYSFLIGGDGNVYVGRGWGKTGAFAHGWNSKSVGIAFIGTFNDVQPSDKMMSAARKLLHCGKVGGFLSNDVKVLGHRQVSQTLSPGDKLYALIKKWPEWLATPPQ